jgi:hypothetical protein
MAKKETPKKPRSSKSVEEETTPILPVMEVLEMEEESQEVSPEIVKAVGIAIKQYNVTDAKIAQLKSDFAGLAINGPDDKQGYEVLKSSLSTVVSLRTSVEKARKKLNRNAIDYKRMVDEEAKRITANLLEIENPLKEKKQAYDEEKARLKAEEEARKHQMFVDRTTNLLQRGFTFNGSMYVMGELIITPTNIREYDEAQWTEVVLRAEEIFKAEQEKKQQEELAMLEFQRQQSKQLAIEKKEKEDLLEERFQTRISWLQSKGFAKNNLGMWVNGSTPLAYDEEIKTASSEIWKKCVSEAMADIQLKATPIPTQTQTTSSPTQIAPEPTQTAPPVKAVPPVAQYQATPQPQTIANPAHVAAPVTANDPKREGFYQFKKIVLDMFNDGTPRTRAQWIKDISDIEYF